MQEVCACVSVLNCSKKKNMNLRTMKLSAPSFPGSKVEVVIVNGRGCDDAAFARRLDFSV